MEYNLGPVEQIPDGRGRAFQVGTRTIAVFSAKGKFFAISNRCLHKGASLCEGDLTEDGYVRCPWHNWSFHLHTGENRLDSTMKQRTFVVRAEDGEIILCL